MDIVKSMTSLEVVPNLFHLAQELFLVARVGMEKCGQSTDAGGKVKTYCINALAELFEIVLYGTTGMATRLKNRSLPLGFLNGIGQRIQTGSQFNVIQPFGPNQIQLERLRQ